MKTKSRITSWNAFPSLILFLISLVVYAVVNGGISGSFFKSFISTNAGAVCVAIGVTATIIAGGNDISLGSIVSLVNVVIVTLAGKGFSVPAAALIGLACAVGCGALNGFLIGIVRINPLLTTFATSTAFAGIALWIMPNPGGSVSFTFSDWYSGNLLGFLPTPIAMILILIVIWVVYQRMPAGKRLYAVGYNPQKAFASGVNVYAERFFVHTFAGIAAGIAGICLTANICAGSPTIGSTMSMNSIAAAVIGGVSLNGGIGNVWGAIFGAGFLSILISIVVSANMSSYVQSFIQGLILLLGIIFSVLASSRSKRRSEWK